VQYVSDRAIYTRGVKTNKEYIKLFICQKVTKTLNSKLVKNINNN
jgi:hypothetical protein